MILKLSMFTVAVINTLMTHMLLHKRKSWAYCLVVFIITMLLGYFYLLITYLFSPTFGNATGGLLYFIYIYIVFEESLAIKIFTMLSIWLYSMTIMNISIYIIKIMYIGVSETSLAANYIVRACLEVVFMPAFYFFVCGKYLNILKSIPAKTTYLLTMYPFFGVLALNYDYYYLRPIENNSHTAANTFLLVTFILLGYITILLSIYWANRNSELKQKNLVLCQQMALQHQNYKLLNENIQIRRALEHDFRHHITAIKALMTENKIHDANIYIEKLNSQRIITNLPTTCLNFTIDSLLKYYMSYAFENQIEFKTKLNLPEKMTIDVTDLSIIFGNCAENAIEACLRCPRDTKRFISFHSDIFGKNIVLKIRNSFNGEIKKTENHFQSSKGNRQGTGLANVRQVIKKYNGNLDISYSDHVFEVCIVLAI